MGARLVLVTRDKKRGEAALARCATPPPTSHTAPTRLISPALRRRNGLRPRSPRQSRESDVLINNAGALFSSREVTEDGLELTSALYPVAYFVPTFGLCERLIASAPARMVNTGSDAHSGAGLDFDDLQSANRYSGFKTYGRSKHASDERPPSRRAGHRSSSGRFHAVRFTSR